MSKKLIFAVSTAEKEDFFFPDQQEENALPYKKKVATKKATNVVPYKRKATTEKKNPSKTASETENLRAFLNSVSQLKKEVDRLSFMMSEIRQVLETTSSVNRHLA